jgi:hypothetical protein
LGSSKGVARTHAVRRILAAALNPHPWGYKKDEAESKVKAFVSGEFE